MIIPFSLRMAWRETRAAWRHFLFFFACIALGVGALVGVGLFATGVEQTITREARSLLGGDLEIRLSRTLSEHGRSVLSSLATRGVVGTHASELIAMAADQKGESGRNTQIVELKAVEPNYPLYGELVLDPPGDPNDRLNLDGRACESRGRVAPGECFGALVQESLLIRMGVTAGARLKIGQTTFVITGLIRKEPDRVANAFSLGPRVLISREGLAATELLKPGSRVRERYLLRLPDGMPVEPVMGELRGRLAGESARVSTYRNAQPRLKRFLDQLARYLGLIGLTTLFVGGIGVATTVQAFIREKLYTIAILKTLGADSRTVVQTYLIQAVLLGLIGTVAGAVIGLVLQGVLPSVMEGLFAADLLANVQTSSIFSVPALLTIAKGLALGLLTTLLFTLWPLLTVREIRPALIFRREVTPTLSSHSTKPGGRPFCWRRMLGLDDPLLAVTAIGMGACLAGLSVWQARSWSIGLLFIGALALAILLLWVCALLLVRGLRLLPGIRSLAIRQGVRNLLRPGSHASSIMVSIGVGVTVILAISIMERSLLQFIGETRPTDAPTFFFIDIQPDQKDDFVQLVRRQTGGTLPDVTPLVRSRLHALDGQSVVLDEDITRVRDRQGGGKRWFFTREYVLTFLADLPRDNVVVKGRWWNASDYRERPLVSVEEEAARNLGLDLGSTVEFEIQGATVAAEVGSIRRVDWGRLSTNFFMILSPGVLDGAPFTYVATIRVPPEKEVALQQSVVAAFPNVTAINVSEVLESFARILDRLSLAIRSIAVFCILAGVLVMAAALAATKYRRLYESVVLKALGATRGLIARSFAVEYAMVGGVAGSIGVLLACGLSWMVVYFFLDVPWSFQPGVLLAGLGVTVLLALTVGFLSTFRILGQPPLSVLRHE